MKIEQQDYVRTWLAIHRLNPYSNGMMIEHNVVIPENIVNKMS